MRKNVDPHQTQRSEASDLGLNYFPMSLLWTLSINGLIVDIGNVDDSSIPQIRIYDFIFQRL